MAGPLARAAVLAGAVLAVLVGPAAAQALPERPAGYVSDGTGRLRPDTVARLDADLAAYEARSGNEIGVAVVATTGGTDIAEYSRQVFNHWGVGQAGLDNGALLVVAVDDRRLRLEVGDGLRQQLSDAAAASIVEAEIVPRLRNGDLDGGVEAGVLGARRALGDDVRTPDGGAEPAAVQVPYQVGAEPDGGFSSVPDDRSPWDWLGGWALLGLGVAAVVAVASGISSSGARSAAGAGSDRCPECGDLLGRRPVAEPTGARYWMSECRSCSYRSGFARGGTWGQGAGLFGALGAALLTGDRRRDDGPGLFGWGSGGGDTGAGGSGGSFGGGSFGGGSSGGGSSGGGSIGGGGSSSGGGASGSW